VLNFGWFVVRNSFESCMSSIAKCTFPLSLYKELCVISQKVMKCHILVSVSAHSGMLLVYMMHGAINWCDSLSWGHAIQKQSQ
jgi:hypothetical protein